MTLEEVAQELRLSVSTLRTLEADRFEDLPEPIFVRGYVRSYARLLEMDDQAIVDEYERLVGTSEPELTPTSSIRRQAMPGDPFFRSATFLIVVAIAVLIGAWWFSRSGPEPEPRTADSGAEEAIVALEPAPSVLPETEPFGGTPPSTPQVPRPESVAEAPTVQGQDSDPAISDTGAPVSGPEVPAEPALPIIEEPGGTRTASAPEIPAETESEPEQSQDAGEAGPVATGLPLAPLVSQRGRLVAASQAPQGEDVLVLRTQEETWAEVVDANGYQLLYYLLRPGMERRMQGKAPFRVFLGNAPAVDLSLNNEPFDHSNFHRPNRTARFTVDDAS
jgi:cytoskeleton protein RodZ